MLPGLWAIGALAAATVTPEKLAEIARSMGEKDGTIFAMPYFLGLILPSGLMGILVAAMLAADMSTDSSYMLTWGSVIYNDVLGPFRRRRLSERAGILWNRFIVAGIGLFLLFWGLWYKLEGDLWAYLQLTGTIYLAAMSILLIACCYWRGANNWGAIAAIIVGAGWLFAHLPGSFLDAAGQAVFKDGIAQTIGWKAKYIGDAWLNIGTYAATAAAMVIGSLLKSALGRHDAAHRALA